MIAGSATKLAVSYSPKLWQFRRGPSGANMKRPRGVQGWTDQGARAGWMRGFARRGDSSAGAAISVVRSIPELRHVDSGPVPQRLEGIVGPPPGERTVDDRPNLGQGRRGGFQPSSTRTAADYWMRRATARFGSRPGVNASVGAGHAQTGR